MDKKKPINWNRVGPGDIISFDYKAESGDNKGRNIKQTILVLNPRLKVILKDSSRAIHLVGIKLEESNRTSLLLNDNKLNTFSKVGVWEIVDEENSLYKLIE